MATTSKWTAIIVVCFCFASCLFAQADQCQPTGNQYPLCQPLYVNISVSEGLDINTGVVQLNCSDLDGDRLQWTIAEGNTGGYFRVSATGLLTTKKRLDAEGKNNLFMLFIEVSDNREPRLTTTIAMTIILLSINDQPPLIRNIPKEVEVPEDTPIGTIIANCTLYDADSARQPEGLARVEIVAGNAQGLFSLDTRTCALSLQQRLDYEVTTSHLLLLRAFELGQAAPLVTLQNLTVKVADVNDQPPICEHYVILLTLSEDTVPGTVVTTLNCSDPDVTDVLRYSGDSGSPSKLSVEPTTGKVSVAAASDFETEPRNYDFIVRVWDMSSQPMTATLVINVQITDVDDNPPRFPRDAFQADVADDAELGFVVMTLTASDDDSPFTPFSDVTFNLTSATHNYFRLHPSTGLVTVSSLLDGASGNQVLLTVAAFSSDRFTLSSTTLVNITIRNSSDQRPVLNQTLYTARVGEDAAVGTTLLYLGFTNDGIIADNNVTFSLSSSKFSVSQATGAVYLSRRLDLESKTLHTFVVTMTYNASSHPLTSQALVEVEVEGVNEKKPVWVTPASDGEVRYVSEVEIPGCLLFSVSATDEDQGDDGRVTYHLHDVRQSSVFLADSPSGRIFLRSKLDKERLDNYVVVLEARDSSPVMPLTATVTLTVSVTDYNDNAPVCHVNQTMTVPSSAALGEHVCTISCTDPDVTNPTFTFVKVRGDVDGVFELHPSSGALTLIRVPTEARYELVIQVRDKGVPEASTLVYVTLIMELFLGFTNLPATVSVSEDAEIGSVVFVSHANGSLLPTFYSVSQVAADGLGDEESGQFVVETSTGTVILSGGLDRERQDVHVLVIGARNGAGHSTTATLTVTVSDVNDNKPVFVGSVGSLSVVENVAVPQVLLTLSVRDHDLRENGTVTFHLLAGDDGSRFSLDADGKLTVVSPLDAEETPLYNLLYAAQDGGTPPRWTESSLLIVVEDVDEFRPQIVTAGQDLQMLVSENATLGAPVLHVMARDSDANDVIKFDLVSGNEEGSFILDRASGQLLTSRKLDRESTPVYRLTVRASSSRQGTAETVITLSVADINDNAPLFSNAHYAFVVRGDSHSDTAAGNISVTDSDDGINGEYDIEIVSGDIDDQFYFDGNVLKIRNLANASATSSHTLVARATDRGVPALGSDVTVHVTVLPEMRPPKFYRRTDDVRVSENCMSGMLLYDFQAEAQSAREGEAGDIRYTITTDNLTHRFYLHSATGELYLLADLDYEQERLHRVSVRATHVYDESLYDVMTLNVHVEDVNDVTPTFTDRYLWMVSEGLYEGESIGRVAAVDLDDGEYGQVSYALTGDSRFFIDSVSGDVTISGRLLFGPDRDFSLLVTASDHAGAASRTGSTSVLVQVLDTNDHAPSFLATLPAEVTVSEWAMVGTPVSVVIVQDGDFDVNARVKCSIASGNEAKHFHLDPFTCVLTTSASLDAESQSFYNLTIIASDSGLPPQTGTTSFVVRVGNENDNTPSFASSEVTVDVTRTAAQGSLLLTLSAVDIDSGPNGQVLYLVSSGDDSGLFAVDPQTGQLTTRAPLGHSADRHTLLITATDRGYPPRHSTASVTVRVQPPLSADSAVITWTVREDSAAGHVVGTLPASSWNQSQSIDIVSGNYRNSFVVTSKGVVKLWGQVDREDYPQYVLHLVRQSADGQTDSLVVTVLLTDVNDNAPAFFESNMFISLVEHLAPGNILASLQVSDLDEGANAEVTLNFTTDSPCHEYFSLAPGGEIAIKQPVDYDVTTKLVCEVIAIDSGSPALTSAATLTVSIVDVVEDVVYVDRGSSSVYISFEFLTSAAAGRLLYTLTPNNLGMTLLPGDNLTFTSVREDGVFTVSAATGEVLLRGGELLQAEARYVQWAVAAIGRAPAHGGLATSTLVLLRGDAFNGSQHLVALSLDLSSDQAQQRRESTKKALQALFPGGPRLEILDVQHSSGSWPSRRLLSVQCLVLVYAVRDSAGGGVIGINSPKVFLPHSHLLQVLQQSPEGTPTPALLAAEPHVLQVMPYYDDLDTLVPGVENWLETREGQALVAVGIGLMVALVLVLSRLACRLHRRQVRKIEGLDNDNPPSLQQVPAPGPAWRSKCLEAESQPAAASAPAPATTSATSGEDFEYLEDWSSSVFAVRLAALKRTIEWDRQKKSAEDEKGRAGDGEGERKAVEEEEKEGEEVLPDGLVVGAAERPRNIPAPRRQSFFS